METKRIFSCELAYAIGLILLACGTALMERADFGLSMVVAPAYLLYLKVSLYLSFFTFGMAEYLLQAFILLIMGLFLQKFKLSYLGSFVTAVIYGFILDAQMKLLALLPCHGMAGRIIDYIAGMLLCAVGIALLFHTYLAPEAYELLVKELAEKHLWKISKVKTIYDCCSCSIGIMMSFLFFGFGHFEGIKWGTVLCALINGTIIGICNKILESKFIFPKKSGSRSHH